MYVNFAFNTHYVYKKQSSRQIMYYRIGPTDCDAVTPHAWLWTICWALGGTCPLQTGGKNGLIKSTVKVSSIFSHKTVLCSQTKRSAELGWSRACSAVSDVVVGRLPAGLENRTRKGKDFVLSEFAGLCARTVDDSIIVVSKLGLLCFCGLCSVYLLLTIHVFLDVKLFTTATDDNDILRALGWVLW